MELDKERYLKTSKSKITSERQLVLKDFLDVLNPLREARGFKPLTPSRLAMMLSHISTPDLKIFYGMCKQAPNFSKYFWYKLK